MTFCFWGRVDDATATLGASVWTALQYGTGLVLLTALLLYTVGRRLPAGVHAFLWTVALIKFILPCGPALVGSLSQTLDAVADPLSLDAAKVLNGDVHPWLFYAKIVLLAIYALVVAILALRAIRGWRRHGARARKLPPAPDATVTLVARCARRLGIRPPQVRVCDEPVAPHVAGVVGPILVLPGWLVAEENPEAEAFILHELAHLKRHDHWLLLAIAFVEIVFFFWPPVHFAARRLRTCREAACDETAVQHGPLAAPHYARSLVGVAARCLSGGSGLVPSAVSSRLEERVDYLMAPPRRPARIFVPLLVAVWATWVLAGSPPPKHHTVCDEMHEA